MTERAAVADLFDEYFEVVLADTPELREQAHRLRYQVYCVENPFEDPAQNPDGLESDAYDTHALHSLLIHRRTQAVAGTVRVVLPLPDRLTDSFPMQRVSDSPLLRDSSTLPLAKTGEASRLAVSKDFRRRAGEEQHPDVNAGLPDPHHRGPERRVMPYITLGLLRAILSMSVSAGLTHILTVPDATVLRLYRRFGLLFKPLGDWVDYHGRRQPSYSDFEGLVGLNSFLHRERYEHWRVITANGTLWPPP